MLLRTIGFVREDLKRGVDVVIVSRETLPRYTPLCLKYLLEKLYQNTVLIWDFDDDIFKGGEISFREAALLKKYSRYILVTGKYLKHLLSKEEQKKVFILPTTDGGFQKENKTKLIEKRAELLSKEVRLVWIGTSSSLKNLEKIIMELDDFAKRMKTEERRTSLTIVCNQKLDADCSYLEIKNIAWTRERAEKAVRAAHIGIMPLLENEYNLGKGGFKLIQYMAAGLPVAASSVGYNLQVVRDDYGRLIGSESSEWADTLTELVSSKETWKKYSLASCKAWKNQFDYKQNFQTWQELLVKQFEQKITYSIVIVNWNSGKQLKKCLDSIKYPCGKQYQIEKVVIVDNASKDHSADFDRKVYPFVCELIQNEENMGFAYACNQGSRICGVNLRHGRKTGKKAVDVIQKENICEENGILFENILSGSEYLLFLNPDTMLQEDTLSKLSRYLLRKPEHIGIVGVQLFDEQGHISRTCSHFPNKARRLCKILGITRLFPPADVIMEGWDHKISRQVDQIMERFLFCQNSCLNNYRGLMNVFLFIMKK